MLDQILCHLETGEAFEFNAQRLLGAKPPGCANTCIECLADACSERAATRDLALSAHNDNWSDNLSAGSGQTDVRSRMLGKLSFPGGHS